jgi:hypothetical protein
MASIRRDRCNEAMLLMVPATRCERPLSLGQRYPGLRQQGMDIEIVPDFRALGHDRSLHAGEIDEGCDPDLRSLRDLFRRDLPTPRPPKNDS